MEKEERKKEKKRMYSLKMDQIKESKLGEEVGYGRAVKR